MNEPGIRLPEPTLPAAPADGNGTSGLAAGDEAPAGPGLPTAERLAQPPPAQASPRVWRGVIAEYTGGLPVSDGTPSSPCVRAGRRCCPRPCCPRGPAATST